MTERRKMIEVVMVCLIIVGSMAGYYLGNNQGYQAGYAKGDESGYLRGHGVGYRNPTYQEMLDFLSADLTNCLIYHDPTFICSDYAATLSKNAYELGYRCFSIDLYFNYPSQRDSAHWINAFNTTDRGLVYVEPQSDQVMHVAIGQKYWESNGCGPKSYNDTVTKIVIFP